MNAIFDQELSLVSRIYEGLDRVSSVLRTEQWAMSHAAGVTPTQVSILALLAGRSASGMKVKDIATLLGVSQPTATDSLQALERKKLVSKSPSKQDARTSIARISSSGRKLLRNFARADVPSRKAIHQLTVLEQVDYLLLLIKTIRNLQQMEAIPVQRMCVTCRYFQPNVHCGAPKPHHCAFVNAAFGNPDLRVECSDHETADPVVQAATWTTLNMGTATPQAT
jgi:DNA-binding MarR family transcriptional regulator